MIRKAILTLIVLSAFSSLFVLADYFAHSEVYFKNDTSLNYIAPQDVQIKTPDSSHWIKADIEKFKGKEIQLKFNLKIESTTIDHKLAFTPQGILLKNYKVWINDSLRFKGSVDTYPVIPLFVEDFTKEIITVKIQGKNINNNLGIYHGRKFLIGNIDIIQNFLVAKERSNISYFLVWILPLGSLLVLFSMLSLLTNRLSTYLKATMFCFCLFSSELILSNFLNFNLNSKNIIFIIAFLKCLGSAFIILYFYQKFKINENKKIKIALLLPLLICFFSPVFIQKQFESFIIVRWAIFYGSATSFVLSLFKLIQYSNKKTKGSYQLVYTISLLIFNIFFYLTLNSDYYHITPLFELVLCFTILSNILLEFGDHLKLTQNQKEIIKRNEKDLLIGKTATQMAHDLRKPFNLLKHFLKLKEVKTLPHIVEIESIIEDAESMLSSTMDLARTTPYQCEKINFQELILSTTQYFQYTYHGEPVSITIESNAKHILGEKTKLKRVFLNIMQNALRELGNINARKREVKISHFFKENKSHITFYNNAEAIPQEVLTKLFNENVTTHSLGTGQGLMSCKNIITLHQGNISVQNLNEGVMFTITIPGEKEDDQFQEKIDLTIGKQIDKGVKETQKNILIIHDSPLTCEYLKSLIQKFNDQLNIEIFHTIESALNSCDVNEFDKIFCDYYLDQAGGKLKGDELFIQLKNKERFILVSDEKIKLTDMKQISSSFTAKDIAMALKQ